MAKDINMKEVIAEAKKEIFDGKSTTVKNHLQTLIGKTDGIKARLAMTVKSIEKELETAETELARYSALTVEDAFNEVTAKNTNTWYVGGTNPLSNCNYVVSCGN